MLEQRIIENSCAMKCIVVASGGIALSTVTGGNEARFDLGLIQPFLLYYVYHFVLMLTSIF